MSFKNFMFSIFLLSVVFSCNDSDDVDDQVICTTEFVYGLSVTVKDATTNSTITENITVIITDGDYQEELMFMEGFDGFFGAGEREGNYIIEITSENYQNFTSEIIEVGSTICHVVPESVEVLLQPN